MKSFWSRIFPLKLPGLARFRVNAFVQNRGAAAVFRTIPSDVLTMEQLGMGEIFRKISENPRGLVAVTGPTVIRQEYNSGRHGGLHKRHAV